MSDAELLERFENATLTADDFPHREHLHVAWLYLRQHPLIEVLDRFPRNLRRLAAALGANSLYHETITWFFILLVHDRMTRGNSSGLWEDFADTNRDLFDRSSVVMNRYYLDSSWRSEIAKKAFILPDRPRSERSRAV